MVEFEYKENYEINDLLKIMELLRSEQGCAWDREQTHESIRKNFIEETYEAVEAIDAGDKELLKEELGDVLLQVVFHSEMEKESGGFNFSDVVDGICKKLIVRHPHVFGDVKVSGSSEILKNWESIKQYTKGQKTYTETLKSVPNVLPALMRSAKVQSRAAKSGFDYKDVYEALNDLKNEITELEKELNDNNADSASDELGDVLFSAVNISRFLDNDAEYSLNRATDKFISRFEFVENNSKDIKKSSPEELDLLWKQAKK